KQSSPLLLLLQIKARELTELADRRLTKHLNNRRPIRAQLKNGDVCVEARHASEARSRVAELFHELRLTVAGRELHEHKNLLGPDREVHRAADGGDRIGGTRVPV